MMQYSSAKGKRYTDCHFSAQPLPIANLGSTQNSRSNRYTVSFNALESTNTWIPLVATAGACVRRSGGGALIAARCRDRVGAPQSAVGALRECKARIET